MCGVDGAGKNVVVLGSGGLIGDEFGERVKADGEAVGRSATDGEGGGVFNANMVDGVVE